MISGAQLESVDISSKALEVAKRNNELNGTNVNFYLSDCFENVTGKFDLIISNPPYIDRDTYVQDSVLKYEPHSALFADDHGLAIYEKIITSLIDYINDKAIVAFEISPDLVERLITLVDKTLKRCKYCIEKDINGFDRYLFIYIN
jgi:release factor glutamine methyltransferase